MFFKYILILPVEVCAVVKVSNLRNFSVKKKKVLGCESEKVVLSILCSVCSLKLCFDQKLAVKIPQTEIPLYEVVFHFF